ncbi:MAG: hypothetical protein ACYC35_15270 [Pirellulales bacterium]
MPNLDPMDAAMSWTITAIGKRPVDHMVRDLLFGSLIRDPRGFMFRQRSLKPDSWITTALEESLGHLDPAGIQLISLASLHYEHLANARTSDEPFSPKLIEVLRRARRCWPMGAQVEPPPNSEHTPRDVCQNAHVCPWCHARTLVAIHKALTNGPLRTLDDRKLLVGARYTVPGSRLDELKLSAWLGYAPVAKKMNCGSEPAIPLTLAVRYANLEIKAQLRRQAEHAGIHNGLVTHQLGPHLDADKSPGFRHQIGFLGEVNFKTPEALEAYAADIDRSILKPLRIHVMGEPVFGQWLAIPADTQQALRLLLFGSSNTYSAKAATSVYGAAFDSLRDGIPGALSLEPTYLYTPAQLHAHLLATQGVHLYTPFGTWREAIGDRRRQPACRPEFRGGRPAPQPPLPAVAAGSRRTNGEAAFALLLQTARPLWPTVVQRVAGKPGRPAYRHELTTAMRDAGHVLSKRKAESLLKKLRRAT